MRIDCTKPATAPLEIQFTTDTLGVKGGSGKGKKRYSRQQIVSYKTHSYHTARFTLGIEEDAEMTLKKEEVVKNSMQESETERKAISNAEA